MNYQTHPNSERSALPKAVAPAERRTRNQRREERFVGLQTGEQ